MIYRIEHNECDGTGKTRFTLSDNGRGYLTTDTNVNCGFLIEDHPGGFICGVRASWRDPAVEGKVGYGSLNPALCDIWLMTRILVFEYSQLKNASSIANSLYALEWHTRRSFLPDDNKSEFIRLLRFEIRHLFPTIFDEALALIPKYDRYNYPSMSGEIRNVYLEYDAMWSDAVDDTI